MAVVSAGPGRGVRSPAQVLTRSVERAWTVRAPAAALQSTRGSGPRHHREARNPQGFRASSFWRVGSFDPASNGSSNGGRAADLAAAMATAGVALLGRHGGSAAHVALA